MVKNGQKREGIGRPILSHGVKITFLSHSAKKLLIGGNWEGIDLLIKF